MKPLFTPIISSPTEVLTVVRSLPINALRLPFPEGKRWVPYQSVVVCQSEGNYTRLYFRNGTSLLYSRTLAYVLALLPESTFIRIHRSHAINQFYIESLGKREVCMKDGSIWSISRRRTI